MRQPFRPRAPGGVDEPDAAHGRVCKGVYDLLVVCPMVGLSTLFGLSAGAVGWELGGAALLGLFVGVFLLFGAWLCETVTAALLAAVVRVRGVEEPYRFWRAITRYTGGFLILTAGWGTLSAITFVPAPAEVRGEMPCCCTIGLVVIFFWWSLSLGATIRARGEPGWRPWLGCVLVPLVGMGSAVVAFVPIYSIFAPSLAR